MVFSLSILSVVVGGLLGTAVQSNYEGRISQFITSPESEAVTIFGRKPSRGGWRGEHAGKWLYAASKAYERTGSPELLAQIESVADFVVNSQEPNGYLGCFLESHRFYVQPSENAYNVDWDVWINTYMLKGLCETYVATGNERYLDAAAKLGDLMYDVFVVKGLSIAKTGEHTGMVGTGSIDPFTDLYALRPDPKYKALIYKCIEEMDSTPGLGLVHKMELGMDVGIVGDAKVYEMIRNLTGLAKAYTLFGDKRLLTACTNAWENISEYHLTPTGGPWGGINVNNEQFNRDCCFAPYQVTETCSVMEWMHFNKVMLDITGDDRYANAIEKTAYNTLLGARAEDGNRWIYYLLTNGEYGPGNVWSCCWSSGMIAVEDLCEMMYSVKGKTVRANILSPSEASLDLPGGKKASFTVSGAYPFEGELVFKIREDASFDLALAIPEWADEFSLSLNGAPVKYKMPGGFATVGRKWKAGDELKISLPMKTRVIEAVREYEVNRTYGFRCWYMGHADTFVSFARGPLVYACTHKDTYKEPDPLVITRAEAEAVNAGKDGFTLAGETFKPICLMPPYGESNCRTIWLQVK